MAPDNKTENNVNVRGIMMDENEISRRIGFKSREDLLAMIVIICNGDANKISDNTTKSLTWFEEWMLFFETLWGHAYQRWEDVADDYGLSIHNEAKIS